MDLYSITHSPIMLILTKLKEVYTFLEEIQMEGWWQVLIDWEKVTYDKKLQLWIPGTEYTSQGLKWKLTITKLK